MNTLRQNQPKLFLTKCISCEWMRNSHLSKWKTFHRNTFILKRILLAQDEMSSPNERRDSYQEFSVCGICHGIVEAIVLRVRGPLTATFTIKWPPMTKENVQGGLYWANTEQRHNILHFLHLPQKFSSYEWKCACSVRRNKLLDSQGCLAQAHGSWAPLKVAS